MKLNSQIACEVAVHEGLIRQAYKDSVDVWTWCIGITSKSGHDVERYIDNPQTMRRCLEVWLWVLEQYAGEVRAVFGGLLTEPQFAAALSFHWNTGAIRKASWVGFFKSGDMAEAERRFMFYDKPPEIIERRKKEADLLFRGRWSGDGSVTEYTEITSKSTPKWSSARRVMIDTDVEDILNPHTPAPEPVPADTPFVAEKGEVAQPVAKPLHKSTTAIAGGVTAVVGVTEGVKVVHDNLNGILAGNAWALLAIGLAVVLVVAGVWVIRERRKRGKEYGF